MPPPASVPSRSSAWKPSMTPGLGGSRKRYTKALHFSAWVSSNHSKYSDAPPAESPPKPWGLMPGLGGVPSSWRKPWTSRWADSRVSGVSAGAAGPRPEIQDLSRPARPLRGAVAMGCLLVEVAFAGLVERHAVLEVDVLEAVAVERVQVELVELVDLGALATVRDGVPLVRDGAQAEHAGDRVATVHVVHVVRAVRVRGGGAAERLHVDLPHQRLGVLLGHPIFDAQPVVHVVQRAAGDEATLAVRHQVHVTAGLDFGVERVRQGVHGGVGTLVQLVLHGLGQVRAHALGGVVDADDARARRVGDGLQALRLGLLRRQDAVDVEDRRLRIRVVGRRHARDVRQRGTRRERRAVRAQQLAVVHAVRLVATAEELLHAPRGAADDVAHAPGGAGDGVLEAVHELADLAATGSRGVLHVVDGVAHGVLRTVNGLLGTGTDRVDEFPAALDGVHGGLQAIWKEWTTSEGIIVPGSWKLRRPSFCRTATKDQRPKTRSATRFRTVLLHSRLAFISRFMSSLKMGICGAVV
ncbi:hypothetical protein MXAN_2038 [Myxococcus xanthus DK 1622]|uniref:Uncharacterized protein n=1 Tax=Myxococcus xanthus (strain DK1622) TaxID=246197 RepID=Q1DAQ7_MYXXD|nr:hypothetical protein MXAN_2038 [Myxococcus xanthus DK 1622]